VQLQRDDDEVAEQDQHEPQQAGQQRLGAELEGMYERPEVGQDALASVVRVHDHRRRDGAVGVVSNRDDRTCGAPHEEQVLAQARRRQRRGDDVRH
jgi:hypothetical protein